jgi:hypothetical protein
MTQISCVEQVLSRCVNLLCVTNKTRMCGKSLVSNKDVRTLRLGKGGSMKSIG